MSGLTEEPTLVAGEDTGTTVQEANENVAETTKKLETMSLPFTIWPPSQRTRDAVIKRLIQTLTEKSVLSDRYGTMSSDEAAVLSRRIEEECFSAATASPASDGDDGVEILQCYSKEISKRMLDSVKSRSVSSEPSLTADVDTSDAAAPTEESSTVET